MSVRLLVPVVLAPLLVLALLLASSGCGSKPAASAGDGAGLVILSHDGPLARGVETRDPRPYFHDFGRVPDGETVTHVFRLRNDDPRDVSIGRVDPGCGCTVAALRAVRADGSIEKGAPINSKAERLLTVAPGEHVELEVRVDTRDLSTKNADKLITLRVLTDSPNGHYLTFEVHVIAELPFTVVPATLALGSIPENGGGVGKIEIVRAGGFQHELKELLPLPEGVTAELSMELRSLIPVWVLEARLQPPLARGPREATLRIATEEAPGVPGREILVPLTALVVEDLATAPERLVFAASRDATQRTTLELYSRLAGHRLRVTGIEVPEDQRGFLSAEAEPVEPDDGGRSLRWRITLETKPPLPAEPTMWTGALVVALDDPQHPSQRIEYVVHVK